MSTRTPEFVQTGEELVGVGKPGLFTVAARSAALIEQYPEVMTMDIVADEFAHNLAHLFTHRNEWSVEQLAETCLAMLIAVKRRTRVASAPSLVLGGKSSAEEIMRALLTEYPNSTIVLRDFKQLIGTWLFSAAAVEAQHNVLGRKSPSTVEITVQGEKHVMPTQKLVEFLVYDLVADIDETAWGVQRNETLENLFALQTLRETITRLCQAEALGPEQSDRVRVITPEDGVQDLTLADIVIEMIRITRQHLLSPSATVDSLEKELYTYKEELFLYARAWLLFTGEVRVKKVVHGIGVDYIGERASLPIPPEIDDNIIGHIGILKHIAENPETAEFMLEQLENYHNLKGQSHAEGTG